MYRTSAIPLLRSDRNSPNAFLVWNSGDDVEGTLGRLPNSKHHSRERCDRSRPPHEYFPVPERDDVRV